MYARLPSVKIDGQPGAQTEWRPRQAFPFEARANRLVADFMDPLKLRIAYLDGKLIPAGWAICRFLYEIANVQARRLARIEMSGEYPKEAPWLWRDLYQMEASDRANRVSCGVPRDAIELYRPEGHGWFLSWQSRLWQAIGTMPAMGRRDPTAPALAVLSPDQAFERLA